MRQALGDRHAGRGDVADVDGGGHQQQASDRLAKHLRVLTGGAHSPDGWVGGGAPVALRKDRAAQALGQRRGAKAHAVLAREQLAKMLGGGAVATGVEHPREQLLGGLSGLEVEHLLLFAAQHQTGLELQQGGDQHDELGGGLQVQLLALAARSASSLAFLRGTRVIRLLLEMVEVGEHDFGQLQLQQVHLFAQHKREQQVERAAEDVQVELERGNRGRLAGRVHGHLGEAHLLTVSTGDDGAPRCPPGAPTPMRSRTSCSVSLAIACA